MWKQMLIACASWINLFVPQTFFTGSSAGPAAPGGDMFTPNPSIDVERKQTAACAAEKNCY